MPKPSTMVKTQDVLKGYQSHLEQQLGRLYAAKRAIEEQLRAVTTEIEKLHQALANLGTVHPTQEEPEEPEPPIRETGLPPEGQH